MQISKRWLQAQCGFCRQSSAGEWYGKEQKKT